MKFGIPNILLNILFLPILFLPFETNLITSAEPLEENSSTVIWQDDFKSEKLNGWKVSNEVKDEESNWFIEKGFLIQDTDCGNTKTLFGTNIFNGDNSWSDYVLRTNLVCTDDDYIGVLFRVIDENNFYRFLLSSQRKFIGIDKKVDGKYIPIISYTKDEWEYVRFSVTIFLKDDNIKVYLNDELFFDINDDQFAHGAIGFTSISNLGSFFDDVTIYSDYTIERKKTVQKISRGPYLQNLLDNHAVVMWNTALPAKSIIEYGQSKENTKLIEITDLTLEHEVKIEGLERESVYYYRVKADSLTSNWYSFKSAVNDTSSFSFIIYGDTQLNFLRHTEIASQFPKNNFDFIIHCGDVVQYAPRDDWDVEFFDPLKNILSSKPIYAAIGNHALNSENFYKNFSNPNPEHENYYSFQYGNSFFIVIDNPRAGYPDRSYYTDYTKGSKQYRWLESELSSEKAQNAEWIFVVSHIPSYVAGTQDFFSGCKENLVPLFEKYNIDFSFSGHVHGYERGKVNNVNYIITAGGGGALNKKGSSYLKQYKDFKRVYNFCRIDVSGSTISFYAFDKNNEVIDEFSVTKETNGDN